MAEARQNDKTEPGQIDAGDTPTQMMVRYARGRVSNFPRRQGLTVAAGVMLAAIGEYGVALAVVLALLLGEAIDCLFLRTVPRRLAAGQARKTLTRISMLTGFFQAISIGFSALIALHVTGGMTSLFTIAFLASASINAGLILPFCRRAAEIRLIVYGATTVTMAVWLIMNLSRDDPRLFLEVAGLIVMTFMVTAFIDFVAKGSRRHRSNLETLARQRTDLERANADLRDSKMKTEELSLVARHANDGVILCNDRREVLWVNDAFTKITGYDLEDVKGRPPRQVLGSPRTCPDTLATMVEKAARCEPFRGHVNIRTKDARDIWVESNQVPILSDDGRIEKFVMVERDITEAKMVARKLAKAKKRAEAGERAKAEFLAIMSHEIRTPMNGVIGMTDLICETDLSQEQKVYADAIRSSAQSLLHLINDILDLSKLNAKKMHLNPVDFDLHGCLRVSLLLFKTQAASRNLELDLTIGANVPRFVTGDDNRLRQILINLIGNALKFTEEGGVTLEVSAGRQDDPLILCFAVHDTGIGIEDDKKAAIFQPFGQADVDTTRKFGGTGLGLTISKKLADIMGGRITVTSQPGVGSCFCLHVPLRAAKRADQPRASKQVSAQFTGRTILIADDNSTNRLLIQKFLKSCGARLLFATDGLAAVQMVQDNAPDLVLMDMSMPGKNGIDATSDIRKTAGPQPVIIAVTANDLAEVKRACLAAGMDDFLTKPIRRNELLAALDLYLHPPPSLQSVATG